MNTRPLFEASADTRLLYQRLRKTPAGETVAYNELSEIVGYSVQKRRGPLETAKRRCLKDDGIVFCAIKEVGLQRLTDKGIVDAGPSFRDHIRRTSRKAIAVQSCVKIDQLTEQDRVRNYAQLSLFGTTAAFTSDKAEQKIIGAVTKRGDQLSIGRTMELFAE